MPVSGAKGVEGTEQEPSQTSDICHLPLHGWFLQAQPHLLSRSCHMGNIWGATLCQETHPRPSCLTCLQAAAQDPIVSPRMDWGPAQWKIWPWAYANSYGKTSVLWLGSQVSLTQAARTRG